MNIDGETSFHGHGALIQFAFTITITLSAVLLFCVQPMIAKMVLPLLGGTPAVWNTSMVFFQAALLAGYAYAHFSTQIIDLRRQSFLHLLLLVSAFVVLPVAIATNSSPPTEGFPGIWLMALLITAIGLPFFALSATAPLLQKWFAHTRHDDASNPYFLYAASNFGSILALLAYPVLIEPFLGLNEQSRTWAYAYGGLVALMATCAFLLRRYFVADAVTEIRPAASGLRTKIDWKLRSQWMILAFVPSSLLLGVTTHITTDIASVPLFWVVPLALFLLTFVIVFSKRPVLRHKWIVSAHAYIVLLFVFALYAPTLDIRVTLSVHLVMFFVTAMLCHGELAKRRPSITHLTEFYLWMSFGGVLGGVFNALVAPVIFTSSLEYPIAVALACALRPALADARQGQWKFDIALPLLLGLVLMALFNALPDTADWVKDNFAASVIVSVVVAMVVFGFSPYPIRFAIGIAVLLVAMSHMSSGEREVLLAERNFFGIHKVKQDDTGQFNFLEHGTTIHGAQSVDPEKWRDPPLTYYIREGPAGQLFEELHSNPRDLSIGIVGLGTGALACYRRSNDDMVFYEIDAAILAVAKDDRFFHYLDECAPESQTVLGDARLTLAREPDNRFDLLVIDAFSSDSIPVHLITREAIDLYFRKLRNDGLLLIHMSNRNVDIEPVLGSFVKFSGIAGRIQRFRPDKGIVVDEAESESAKDAMQEAMANFRFPSDWVLLAADEAALGKIAEDPRWKVLKSKSSVGVWTDDYSNIIKILRFGDAADSKGEATVAP